MKKLIVRLLLVVVLLVVAAGVVGYVLIDVIAKAGVEEGGTYALGVQTNVDALNLSPFSGEMKMTGLKVANPEGFASPHLMHTGTFDLELVPGSLLGDTVEVRKFELDGLDVNIEQKVPQSNVSVILKNLERFADGGAPAEEKPAGETKVKVDRITVRNVVATFHLPAVGPLQVKVPAIELTNVTSDEADGVVIRELVVRLVPAILAAVLEKAQGIVPPDVLGVLNGDVSALSKALGGRAEELVQKVHADLGTALGQGAGKLLGTDANSAAEGAKKAIGGALEGLLPGKKDPNTGKEGASKKASGLLDGLLGGKKDSGK